MLTIDDTTTARIEWTSPRAPRYEGQYVFDKDGTPFGTVYAQRRNYLYLADGTRLALHNIGTVLPGEPRELAATTAPTPYFETLDIDALWETIGHNIACENPF